MRRKIPRPALIGGLSILIVRKGPFNAYRAYYDHDRKEFVYLEYQHPVLGEPRRVQVNASPRGAGVE
ncbi:MAG: hypothetical protein ABI432_07185 [Flavobacteriales bacterium]